MVTRLAVLTLIYAYLIGISNAAPLWQSVARTASYVAASALVAIWLLRRRKARHY